MIPSSVRCLRAVPVLCALLGLVTVAVIVLLAGGSGDGSDRRVAGGVDADRPEVRHALARAHAQGQRLATPRARRQRQRSRSVLRPVGP